jgi:UrcA family protein
MRTEGLNIMHKLIVPALAALSLAVLPTPAAAQTTTESVEVPHRDLDLSTAAGMDTLQARIERAITRVCGPVELRPFFKSELQRRCVREANVSAEVQVARIVGGETPLALNVVVGPTRR